MRILVTGAKGFVGKNLCVQLNNIKDGKARCYGNVQVEAVNEYDLDSTPEELDRWCAEADFVFNLAGVNRPQNQEEFMQGNFGFASTLLDTLKKHKNNCPVMLSSSQQASLTGRFGNSEYGRSKKAGEDLFLEYGKDTSAKVLVYRFPNLFGKWCRPNYNSAVATFCNAVANDLSYTVNDPSVELELLYIDDLVDEMIACLKGEEHHCEFDGLEVLPKEDGRYCYVPTTHKATLGEIVGLLNQYAKQPRTLIIPEIPTNSFAKKLYSTYLSYLPKEKVAFSLQTNEDSRGTFTELIKTLGNGQMSVNVSKPGITKGQHWHNTKWEFFIVVSGKALIQERKIGSDEILNFEVTGDNIQAVHMLPGYTHNIINLSEIEPLVTLMWANEIFDPNRPDTYYETVEKKDSNIFNMSVNAIIQARCSSTRFPAKVFADIDGKPLIWHVIDRLRHAKKIDRIIIATTVSPKDDRIEEWCKENGVDCFRGSEENVLNRYYSASEAFPSDYVVRITADDPFKEPAVIDAVITKLTEEGYDHVTNNLPPSFPEGLDCEAFKKAALDRSEKEAETDFEREHVTQYIYHHPEIFKIGSVSCDRQLSHLRWTIDKEVDLEMVRAVYAHRNPEKKGILLMDEILQILKDNPEIEKINSKVERSAMYKS